MNSFLNYDGIFSTPSLGWDLRPFPSHPYPFTMVDHRSTPFPLLLADPLQLVYGLGQK